MIKLKIWKLGDYCGFSGRLLWIFTRVPIRGERRLESVVDVTTEEKNWYDTRKGSKTKECL